MGRDLAAAGICVVSGLALGIDGAAHAGALSFGQDVTGSTSRRGTGATGAAPAPPAGVGASGVDVPYPRRQTRLWEQVAQIGVILSETPPGRPAQAWRFPARNRIIAALSQMVVVVESHQAGGSLITAEAAIYRGIDVRAVPGPVRSPASAGSNQLLHDGPAPVRNAQDVLDGLGIFLPGPERRAKGAAADGHRVGRVPWIRRSRGFSMPSSGGPAPSTTSSPIARPPSRLSPERLTGSKPRVGCPVTVIGGSAAPAVTRARDRPYVGIRAMMVGWSRTTGATSTSRCTHGRCALIRSARTGLHQPMGGV